MVKKFCFMLVAFIMLSTSTCFGLDFSGFNGHDFVTYFGTTEKTLTIGWSEADGAVEYEAELFHVEQNRTVTLDTTTALEITFQLDKSGHYIARVRSVGEEGKLSEWAESTNPEYATVDGQPRAWWIYGHVASSGPINISLNDSLEENKNGKITITSIEFPRFGLAGRGRIQTLRGGGSKSS